MGIQVVDILLSDQTQLVRIVSNLITYGQYRMFRQIQTYLEQSIYLFIYFNIFIQDNKFSKACFSIRSCVIIYNIYNTNNMTNVKEVDLTH